MLGNLKQKAASAIGGDGNPVEMVMQALQGAGGPMKLVDLAKNTGLDRSVLDTALQTLTRSGKVSCPETDCYSIAK